MNSFDISTLLLDFNNRVFIPSKSNDKNYNVLFYNGMTGCYIISGKYILELLNDPKLKPVSIILLK
jgi:hypothetical protein